MMLKRKSNPWARLKYLCVLPLTAVAVTSFARPEIVHELDKISSVKFNEIIPVSDPQTDKNSKNETSVIELKEAVRFAEEPQKPDTVKKAPVPPQRVIVKDNESAPPPPPHPPVKKKEAEMIIVEDKPGEKTPPPPPPPVPPVKAEAGSKTDDVKVIDAKSLTGTPLTIVGEDNDTIHISSNMFSLRDSKKTPLVVLDGKILEKGTLGKTVKAEDIESMEVLKDASAISLYGEAAENGVVIITTKK